MAEYKKKILIKGQPQSADVAKAPSSLDYKELATDITGQIFIGDKNKKPVSVAKQQALTNHINDKSNPHSVTAEQTGAYKKEETYSQAQVNEKVKIVADNLINHENNTSNPHKVTAEQTGALELKAYENDLAGSTVKSGALVTANLTKDTPLHVVSTITPSGGGGTLDAPIPIKGYTEVNTTVCGKNLVDEKPRSFYVQTRVNCKLPAGKYRMVVNVTAANATYLVVFDDGLGKYEENWLKKNPSGQDSTVDFTAKGVLKGFDVYCDNSWSAAQGKQGTLNKFGLYKYSPEIQEYIPYTGTTYTQPFGKTVYGGNYDWQSGKLTEEWKIKRLTAEGVNQYEYSGKKGVIVNGFLDAPYIRAEGLCSHDVVSFNTVWFGVGSAALYWLGILDRLKMTVDEFRAWLGSNEVYFAYKSEKVITTQLPATEMPALEGVNNIFSNTGDTFVSRRRDSKSIWFDSSSEAIPPIIPQYEKTVTVGASGDFKTINEALEYLSQFSPVYRNKPSKYEIKILSGTVISEQIAVRRMDLSYIVITSEDAQVEVNTTGWTNNGFTDIKYESKNPFFGGEYNAKLPVIGVSFRGTERGSSVGVLVGFNSEVTILPGCGFNDFGIGGISTYGSLINGRQIYFEHCLYYGVRATEGGRIFAPESSFRHNSRTAISADYGGEISVDHSNFGDCYIGIKACNGSSVNAYHSYGGDNPDTSSSEGYIISESGSIISAKRISITSVQAGTTVLSVVEGGIIIAPLRTIPSEQETSQPLNAITADGLIIG